MRGGAMGGSCTSAARRPRSCLRSGPPRDCRCPASPSILLLFDLVPQTTPASSEEYYARLQAFRHELAGMPVAVQVRGAALAAGGGPIGAFAAASAVYFCMQPSPAALLTCMQTAAANEQHYEVPTEYFLAALGPHRKYSSCLYTCAQLKGATISWPRARRGNARPPHSHQIAPDRCFTSTVLLLAAPPPPPHLWRSKPGASLEEAEVAMLELCCERAQLEDGQQVGDWLGACPQPA